MRWRILVAATALVVGMGGLCTPPTPGQPYIEGPDSIYIRAPLTYTFSGWVPEEPVHCVVEWGDGVADTSTSAVPDMPGFFAVSHRWDTEGTYHVRSRFFLANHPTYRSDWSDTFNVAILPNGVPTVPELDQGPERVAPGVMSYFNAGTTDPDGDSVALRWSFGDWSELEPSPGWAWDSARFISPGSTRIWCIGKDQKGTESDTFWYDLLVGETGAVKWLWWGENGSQDVVTSPLVFWHGGVEQIWVGADFPAGMLRIDPRTGGVLAETQFPRDDWPCTPAWCAATEHLIFGIEDSGVVALHPDRGVDWFWRGSMWLPGNEWSAPAITGNRIYITRDPDTIYCLFDHGDSVTVAASHHIRQIDAICIIDQDGYVYASDDLGSLFRLDPELNEVWRIELARHDIVYSAAIGKDGTVFVGTDNADVHAINPADGSIIWTTSPAEAVHGLVLSADRVFASTENGAVVALNAHDGSIEWYELLLPSVGIDCGLLLTANGLLYAQDIDDRLHCLRQDDGLVVWSCPVEDYIPLGPSDFERPMPSPSILSNGDVLVCAQSETGLFCIGGYEDGPLAQTAWPKWQHDSHNSGNVSGGSSFSW